MQKRTESTILDTALPRMRSQPRLCSYLAALRLLQQGVMQRCFVNLLVSFVQFCM